MVKPMGRTALSALVLGVSLQACGGGGSDSVGEVQPLPHQTCEVGTTVTGGAYMTENNAWNASGASGYRQCVQVVDAGAGKVNATLDWNWPVAPTGVRAYPELIYGQKPWYASTTSALPRVVDTLQTLRVETAFTASRDAGANGNFAFDIWLASSNQRPAGSDHLPITHELMIWLDAYGGMVPAGSIVATVTIGGITWDLYRLDATTWTPEPWVYLAYLPRTKVSSPLSLDVRAFLSHLKQRGDITGQEWLTSVELGNEIVSGKGQTLLTGYAVTAE